MRWVINRHRKRVAKYCLGFFKTDSVLLEVGGGFVFVPIKVQVYLRCDVPLSLPNLSEAGIELQRRAETFTLEEWALVVNAIV